MKQAFEEPEGRHGSHPVAKKSPADGVSGPEGSDAIVESLQRTAGNAAVGELLAARAASSSGSALPHDLRAKAERKLGTDLSSVRIHSDSDADSYVRSAHAEAATIGTDVYLGSNAGDLSKSTARKTLLHELVHATQASEAKVSGPHGTAGLAPELEARTIAASGYGGATVTPTQVAPAGVAHFKTIDEDDQREASDAEQQPAVTAQELLNPQVDPDAAMGPKPGTSGEGEAAVYEISVMQPLREALAKVESQDWEEAMAALQAVGMRLLDYQNVYEKRDPMLYTRLMSARGWLGLAVQHIGQRLGAKEWTDDQIADHMRDDVGEFERIAALIH